MVDAVSEIISQCYYKRNDKIYTSNDKSCIFSNVNGFDAVRFAGWLKNAFEVSHYKSLTQLAADVESNKATLSRLINASPQSLTNKPSKPKRELVQRLADKLNQDADKALVLAGYAPASASVSFEIMTGVHLQFDRRADLTPDEVQRALESTAVVFAGIRAQREAPAAPTWDAPGLILELRDTVDETFGSAAPLEPPTPIERSGNAEHGEKKNTLPFHKNRRG